MCPHMREHWRHLANTIELMLSSAHPSPQSKRRKSIGSAIFAQLTAEYRRAHWRYLASTIELVLLWAHPSHCPQPKLQIDRCSRFCTVHDRNPYTLQWAPLSPKLPLPWGYRPPSNIWLPGPTRSSTQTVLDRFSRFCTDDRTVSLHFTKGRSFPLKIAPSHGDVMWTPI